MLTLAESQGLLPLEDVVTQYIRAVQHYSNRSIPLHEWCTFMERHSTPFQHG